LRVYLIGRGYQATEIDTVDTAMRFIAWFTEPANPALGEVIQTWLWQPPDAGGLGALAESARDVALLRTEIVAAWQRGQPGAGPNGQARHER
jgi:hypothetical protein